MRAKDKRITQMEHMTPVQAQHKPLVDRTERERAEASLVTYTLSPDELEAYRAKYPPVRSLRPNIMRPRPRKEREA
jgi:hypothetical protein